MGVGSADGGVGVGERVDRGVVGVSARRRSGPGVPAARKMVSLIWVRFVRGRAASRSFHRPRSTRSLI